VTGHKDWDAIVVITAPVFGLLNRIATGEYGARRLGLIEKLSAHSRTITEFCIGPGVRDESEPLVQPHEVVAARIAGAVIRSSDISVN
jgi:hypothetical protein